MKHRVLTFLLLLFVASAFSQDKKNVDSLLAVIGKKPHDTVLVNCYVKLASEYKNNEPKTAEDYANKALTLAQNIQFKKGTANAYHVLGMINSYQSNNDKALELYMLALKINEELKDKRAMSTSYNNIGLIYWNQGNYDKALKYYLISLEMDEALGEQKGMASSYNNVGLIYWAQGDLDKAQEYFQKAVVIYAQLKDSKGMGGAYSNIGGVAYYKGKPDVAILYFKKSYDFYKEINFKTGCATALTNISEILIEQKKYQEALDYSNQAIEIHKQLGNKTDLIYGYLSVAKNYMDQGLNSKAIDILSQAIDLSKEVKAQKQLSQSYLMTAQAYGAMNNFKQAYDYYIQYSNVKDSMFTSESAEKIAEMNTKYDTDKKNKEIELLKKESEIQLLNQQAEKSRSAMIRNLLIAGFVFILVLVVVLYNRNQVKQKANLALAEKNKNIEEQKEQIELQHAQLEHKNKEITDSIKYAKNLQLAILPPDNQVKALLPDSFVLYKPKDIVSGDFYWVEEWGNSVMVAAADCTGHGVPGAFMSIVGNNLLQQAVNVFGLTRPALILNNVNKNISRMLHQTEDASSVKDGMDVALLSIEKGTRKIQFAGAYNPMWILSNGQITEIAADKHPVGAFVGEELKQFTNHELELNKGDIVYVFTDGYADQFGGPKGKKFKYSQLKEILLANAHLSMQEQKEKLNEIIESWKGNLEQIDDILIIGIKL
ncbi:MAG: tetratricopeptide repeat protein [Bacteroidetes bacterium]|nr:tetratricopeptide repeat protein [Bacteroidota bacterium]